MQAKKEQRAKASTELVEAMELWLTQPESCTLNLEGDAPTMKLSTVDSSGNQKEYNLSNLFKNANFKQVILSAEALEQYNQNIDNNPYFQTRIRSNIGRKDSGKSTDLKLTNESIEEMKRNGKIKDDLLKLSNGELKAANLYTQKAVYQDLNNCLGNKLGRISCFSADKRNVDKAQSIIQTAMVVLSGINRGINPEKHYTLFRGEGSGAFSEKMLRYMNKDPQKPHLKYKPKKIFSTSLEEEAAKSFANPNSVNGLILFGVFNKFNGLDVAPVSHYEKESEVLLVEPGCKISNVNKVNEKGNAINYEVVPYFSDSESGDSDDEEVTLTM